MNRGGNREDKISLDSTDSMLVSTPLADLVVDGLKDVLPLRRESSEKEELVSSTGIGCGCRLDVRREKAGRGGKTVTTVAGFPPRLSRNELKGMLRDLKKLLGSGGAIVDGHWELQGDHREKIIEWLSQKGFRPVLAGG